MAKTALEIAYRNDRAQIRRVLASQALLPMLETALWILKAELKRPDKRVHVDQPKQAA